MSFQPSEGGEGGKTDMPNMIEILEGLINDLRKEFQGHYATKDDTASLKKKHDALI